MQSKSLKTLLVAAVLSANAHAAPTAHAEAMSAMTAAQRDLLKLATHAAKSRTGAPAGELPFGLATDTPAHARIAYGFPVHTVDPAAMMEGGPLGKLVQPNGQWRFVVKVQGKPVGLATVEKVDGKFTTVAYGAAELAKDLDIMFKRHGNADRSNLRFVRIYQSRADLLDVGGADGRRRYAPMASARAAFDLQRDELLEEGSVIEPLRAAARANLRAFQ